MAKIIYGVAGEGFGHASRAHLIGKKLIDAGHTVMFAGSNKSLIYLKQYFGDSVKEIFGLLFYYKNGRVNSFHTVAKNIAQIKKVYQINRPLFKNQFEAFAPDLVLTDFEPFSAWWAWRHRVPLLSIDNEHLLSHCRLEHKVENFFPHINAYLVTKFYFPGAYNYIVINFFKTAVKSNSVIFAPPIVRPEALARKASNGDHIVIYTTAACDESLLLKVLPKFPSQQFYIYGCNKFQIKENCVFKERSTEEFLDDLASARGVIASAGFSLISECLLYKKKMLLFPVPGQYEQIINAQYIQKFGLGLSETAMSEKTIGNFLDCIDRPVAENRQLLWPDNEKFFEILQDVFSRMHVPISFTGAQK